MTVLTRSRIAAGLAAGAIAGLFLSGAAQAITENVFRYSDPKTGYYTIHPAALAPQHLEQPFDYRIGYDPAELRVDNIRCFQTGLNLPDGAKLTDLRVWYRANTTIADLGPMEFRLFRNAVDTGTGKLLVHEKAVIISGARASENFPLSGPSATVHNRQFMYGFAVCMFVTYPNAFFNGARITYTYTTAGD